MWAPEVQFGAKQGLMDREQGDCAEKDSQLLSKVTTFKQFYVREQLVSRKIPLSFGLANSLADFRAML